MDEAGHDPDLAFFRRDNAGAVRSDKPAVPTCHESLYLHHIIHRDSFSNTDDERDTCINRFHYGIPGKSWMDKDHGDIRFCCRYRLTHSIEDRHTLKIHTALAGCNACYYVSPILHTCTCMERPFLACNALNHYPGRFIYENTHLPPPTNFTIFCAPSHMLEATSRFRPELRSISSPSVALVPSSLTTRGTVNFTSFAASKIPPAILSQRTIPPKILTNTPFTLLSARSI